MNSSSQPNNTPLPSALQADLSYFDFCSSLGPIETLTLESESEPESESEHFNRPPARDSPSPSQPPPSASSVCRDEQMEISFVQRGRIEIPNNVDCQNNTHLKNDPHKEDSIDPPSLLNQSNKMASLEDCEDMSRKINDVKADTIVEAQTMSTEGEKLKELTEVIDTINKSSVFIPENAIMDVSKPNPNKSLQSDKVSSCEREDMVELINKVKTRRKRRKLGHTSENKNEKRCNCKKSGCLKLYCECFSAGVYCGNLCGCKDCLNKIEFEDKVKLVSLKIQSKNNALAFSQKVTRQAHDFPITRVNMAGENYWTNNSSLHKHKKGCNCKKSMCQKKYCECFQAEACCTSACCCENCRNTFGTKIGLENTSNEIRTNAEDYRTQASTHAHASNLIGGPTSNSSNPINGCPESPFGSFSSSVSDPIEIAAAAAASASLQPCGNNNNMDQYCSCGPTNNNSYNSINNILREMMTVQNNGVADTDLGAPSLDHLEAPMAPASISTSNIGTQPRFTRAMLPFSINQRFGSVPYVQQGSNQLNPSCLNLGSGRQLQFTRQIIPTPTSYFTRMNNLNECGSTDHNGGDHDHNKL